MPGPNRIDRLNSSLKEVISDVIRKEVKNPHLPPLLTITAVSVSNDLSHAKVYVSVIGGEPEKTKALEVLNKSAGFIGVRAQKEIVIRHFPELRFYLDESVEKQMKIDSLLQQIQKERETRQDEQPDGN